mmetsp:Transcript_7945/g.32261  ORF Transcript_7945/g.32261 Transcript_7945/m.32261 type:complete len:214 (-) Transcript_7945:185-826(-)
MMADATSSTAVAQRLLSASASAAIPGPGCVRSAATGRAMPLASKVARVGTRGAFSSDWSTALTSLTVDTLTPPSVARSTWSSSSTIIALSTLTCERKAESSDPSTAAAPVPAAPAASAMPLAGAHSHACMPGCSTCVPATHEDVSGCGRCGCAPAVVFARARELPPSRVPDRERPPPLPAALPCVPPPARAAASRVPLTVALCAPRPSSMDGS